MSYGCHNAKRPVAGAVTHIAQTGWQDGSDGFGNPVRVPIYQNIKHVMSTTCQFDIRKTDPSCTGCFQQSNESKS